MKDLSAILTESTVTTEPEQRDRHLKAVLAKYKERAEAGQLKYGTTLERNDLTTLEWLTHAQEEAMDFTLYLERLKSEIIAIQRVVGLGL